jgi:hypothetical protein
VGVHYNFEYLILDISKYLWLGLYANACVVSWEGSQQQYGFSVYIYIYILCFTCNRGKVIYIYIYIYLLLSYTSIQWVLNPATSYFKSPIIMGGGNVI